MNNTYHSYEPVLPPKDNLPNEIQLWFATYYNEFMQILAMDADAFTNDEMYYVIFETMRCLVLGSAPCSLYYADPVPECLGAYSMERIRDKFAISAAMQIFPFNPNLSSVTLNIKALTSTVITYEVIEST